MRNGMDRKRDAVLYANLAHQFGDVGFDGALPDAQWGAYFVMEALVPPGGGPPPHIHRNEDETFYIVEGQCSIRLSGQTVNAAAGDFVNVPRGIVHCFRNEGTSTMRMVLTYSPSGIEKFFEETLEPALDRRSGPPPNIQALADRFVAAGPKYGIEFFAPGASFTDAA